MDEGSNATHVKHAGHSVNSRHGDVGGIGIFEGKK